MKANEMRVQDFLSANKTRFVIPIYWKLIEELARENEKNISKVSGGVLKSMLASDVAIIDIE